LPWHTHWGIHRVAPLKQATHDQETSSNERYQYKPGEQVHHLRVSSSRDILFDAPELNIFHT
jgi:hypothetical protein